MPTANCMQLAMLSQYSQAGPDIYAEIGSWMYLVSDTDWGHVAGYA